MIKLSLKDRYNINVSVRSLPCTLKLRSVFDAFISQIDLTMDEMSQYAIKFDPTEGFSCNNDEITFEYDKFPEELIDSINSYIHTYDHEKNAENIGLQKRLGYLKKLLG